MELFYETILELINNDNETGRVSLIICYVINDKALDA